MAGFKKTVLVIFISLLFLAPVLVSAQNGRADCPPADALVPCGGSACPCNLCDFFDMINRIITFLLMDVVWVIAVLMVVIAGAMMLSAYAGSSGPELVSRAKKILLYVAIGILVAYLAWILINLFLTALGVAQWTGLRTWWQIDCNLSNTSIVSPGNPMGFGFCGDGVIQSPNGDGVYEICDGNNKGDFTCEDYGLTGGADPLVCLVCVAFNTNACAQSSHPPVVVRGCMDPDAVNRNPNATEDDGSCNYCGNNRIDHGERCDTSVAASVPCDSINILWKGAASCLSGCFLDTSACTSAPVCGNGILEEGPPNESCDCGSDGVCTPAELNNQTCESFGLKSTGSGLGCDSSCYDFDYANCTECGNGQLDPGEGCDGGVGNATCASLGFNGSGGTGLTCNSSNCLLDTSGCVKNYCGDGVITNPNDDDVLEICDGSNVGSVTCGQFNLGPGNITCFNDCLDLDFSGCGDILAPGIGDKIYNCYFRGASLSKLAPFDIDPNSFTYHSVLLWGIWSINKVDNVQGTDPVAYNTDCITNGTASDAGWKNLDDFASNNEDGKYIAFGYDKKTAGDVGSFLFFSVSGHRLVL